MMGRRMKKLDYSPAGSVVAIAGKEMGRASQLIVKEGFFKSCELFCSRPGPRHIEIGDFVHNFRMPTLQFNDLSSCTCCTSGGRAFNA